MDISFNKSNQELFLTYYDNLLNISIKIELNIIIIVGKIFVISKFKESDGITHKHSLTGIDITSEVNSIITNEIAFAQKFEEKRKIVLEFSKDIEFIIIKAS